MNDKFGYRNFLKFQKEIASNPNVFKQRDFLAEKALDYFEITLDELKIAEKTEIIKSLHKAMSICFYLTFKDNDDPSLKIDKRAFKEIEKEFPDEISYLKKNTDTWNFFLNYYSGAVDALMDITNIRFLKDNGKDSNEDGEEE